MKLIKIPANKAPIAQPPSGGCVLKRALNEANIEKMVQPPSGGCVLKLDFPEIEDKNSTSRLQAAVC